MSLDQEVLNKIAHIQLKAGFLASDMLAGEYASAFKGQGMEFEKVRDYIVGDDVRSIDWNVTARMNSPFVKTFKEEREMTVFLMVDVSASQDFGSSQRSKREISAELAAIFASLAIKSSDRVGVILFSDQVELFIPASKGNSHIWHIIKEVINYTPEHSHRKTDISMAVSYLMSLQKRKCQLILVSDFYDDGYQRGLAAAGRRHDLTCVVTGDRREQDLAGLGLVQLRDLESGKLLTVNTSSKRGMETFKLKQKNRIQSLEKYFQKSKIDYFFTSTRSDIVGAIIHFIKKRERRRRA